MLGKFLLEGKKAFESQMNSEIKPIAFHLKSKVFFLTLDNLLNTIHSQ
jgi:hypothetical protein